MCVCVVGGFVFYYIILLGEADKTHLIVLCYYVTKTGLVGAAALLPSFHTYLGDKATDFTLFVSGCINKLKLDVPGTVRWPKWPRPS